MIFDASSIFAAVKNRRLRILKDAKTSRLAKYELGNAVCKEIYMHKTLNHDEGLELLQLLMKIVDKMDLVEPDYAETFKTALKYGITFYDAIYVQLATENSDVLITEDERFKKRIHRDVRVLSISELNS